MRLKLISLKLLALIVCLTTLSRQPHIADGKGLCVPEQSKRAYVTILTKYSDISPIRVLSQSLRDSGVINDFAVLILRNEADPWTKQLLQEDGIQFVEIENENLDSNSEFSIDKRDWALIALWSLTQYDRIVYLSPNTLVIKNPDSLFACEGLCFAPPRKTRVATGGLLNFSDLMVLEPNMRFYNEMKRNYPEVGFPLVLTTSKIGYSREDRFICPVFESFDNYLNDKEQESSPVPTIMLNAAFMPTCLPDSFPSSPDTCHFLPFKYTATSGDYEKFGHWDYGEFMSIGYNTAFSPHLLQFNQGEFVSEGLQMVGKTLYWKWNVTRQKLHSPFFSFLTQLLLILVPGILIASSFRIFPKEVGMISDRDGLQLHFGSKQLPHIFGHCSGNYFEKIISNRLPRGTAAFSFSIVWYMLSADCARKFSDSAWHPLVVIVIQSFWLIWFLLGGIMLLDYLISFSHSCKREKFVDLFIVGCSVGPLFLLLDMMAVAYCKPLQWNIRTLFIPFTLWTLYFRSRRSCNSYHIFSRKHVTCVVICCILLNSLFIGLLLSVATSNSEGHFFHFFSTFRMIVSLLIFMEPFGIFGSKNSAPDTKDSVQSLSLILQLFWKSGNASKVLLICRFFFHLIFHHWDWLIAGYFLMKLSSPLSKAIRMHSVVQVKENAFQRYQMYNELCLQSDLGFANEKAALGQFCGSSETFRPIMMTNGAICMRTSGGKFTTVLRGKLMDDCVPETQFSLQLVPYAMHDESLKAKLLDIFHWRQERKVPEVFVCIYNATTKLYLSSTGHPQSICRRSEHWKMVTWSW